MGRPPFRADHIGSLLRPAVLRQAFRDHATGALDDRAFAATQDECIRAVVRMQEAVGLEVVTDGEFRRGSYWSRFVEGIDGLVIRPAQFKFRDDLGRELDFTAPYAERRLQRARPLATDEFRFLAATAAASPKITIPAPSTLHFYRPAGYADPAVYADDAAFFADVAAIFRAEIADLAAAGCRYIQIDEVAIAMLCDPAIRDKIVAIGRDPDQLVDLYVEAINDAVAAAPEGVVFGVHMCRGNFKGRYLAEGGYDQVAELFFAGTAVNHFLLEYDSARAGGFAPLRFVPPDKGVVLGLVSSKQPALEPLDALRRRIDEAAHYVDLDRLAISPQCGFASTVAGNPVTEADQEAKLARVVETARAVWG
jgi:5-methyltetrahydropteroyltriglutamate--homocysteine methyltransferase